MRQFVRVCAVCLLCVPWLPAAPRTPARRAHRARPATPVIDAAAINNAAAATPFGPDVKPNQASAVVRAAILLDRAHFSPGEIGLGYTPNLRRAIDAYAAAHGLPGEGQVTAEMWKALNADTAPALVEYVVTANDLKGPFAPVPRGMAAQAQLPELGYSSAKEMFGERFHCSQALLTKLNPGKALDQEGTQLMVPSVARAPLFKAASLQLAKSDLTLKIMDEAGQVVAAYPASAGSEHDPLPIGDWKVNGVARNPPFHYNPQLFWDAKPDDTKATIKPGPNNPVGAVWIALSKEHYGIHGTPEPGNIGKTQSHGCIRLTNWDVLDLANVAKPSMPVTFTE